MDPKPSHSGQVSLLSDTPASRDILDYQDYCDALVSIVQGLSADTPMTVGVFGDWGSGKTTLLSMLRNQLRQVKIQSIWVNVWQLGNEEDVWAAFLQSLLLNVKKEMPWFRRLQFNLGLQTRQIQWSRFAWKAVELILRVAIIVVPLYISINYLVVTNKPGKPPTLAIAAGAGTLLSTVLGYYLLLQPFLQAIRQRVNVDLHGLVKSSPLRDRVSLLENFKAYFQDMVTTLVGEQERLVIFVDDLDRCQPERIVQVLDAIRLFLDLPNCVYVLGLDRTIVEQAIREKFADYKDPALEARLYLEKIVNLPFELPPLSGLQMQKLVKELGADLPDAEQSAQVFALGQEPNPRKVKRTINIFLLLWSLSQRRQELKELVQPTRLAKIVVIQHSYRDLYLILTLFPRHLADLEIYFRQLENPPPPTTEAGGVSAAPQDALADYLKPFTSNESLKRLFTMHPLEERETDGLNFAALQDGKYRPIEEEELQAYIHLTRTITPAQKKVPTTSFSPPGPESFVDRIVEQEEFQVMLERRTSEQFLLLKGEPGQGKTSLLLRFEYNCRFIEMPPKPVALVDLAVVEINSAFSVVEKVRQSFSQLKFENFDQLNIARLKKIRGKIATTADLVQSTTNIIPEHRTMEDEELAAQECVNAFFEDLKLFADQQLVILFDSYEKASDPVRFWIENNLLATITQKEMRNIIVVISGRVIPDPYRHPEWKDLARIRSLGGFSREVFAEYLQRIRGPQLSNAELETLYNVSKGNLGQVANLLDTLSQSSQFPLPT